LSTTNAKLIQQNIISTLQIITSLITQYKAFKDEALNIRIILKTNIDTLTINVYQKYSELISEVNHKNILKRKYHQLYSYDYYFPITHEWLSQEEHHNEAA
jgi:hypothetical protein